ncbi:MAG: STAS domain-containing protein [Actinomycetota bacterium]|nr:STAS domain-containing protein [Actinomycetota bacterium]
MPSQASIEIEIHTPTSCIVTLHGEHDMASREAVTMALALARTYSNVLVDLTTCTFIDTTVTNAVLVAAAQLRQVDRSLELIVPGDAGATRRALSLMGVLAAVPLHATRTSALAAVASAELIRTHLRRLELRTLSARIEQLSSKGQAGHGLRSDKPRPGTTVLRAQVAETTAAEAEARKRAA